MVLGICTASIGMEGEASSASAGPGEVVMVGCESVVADGGAGDENCESDIICSASPAFRKRPTIKILSGTAIPGKYRELYQDTPTSNFIPYIGIDGDARRDGLLDSHVE